MSKIIIIIIIIIITLDRNLVVTSCVSPGSHCVDRGRSRNFILCHNLSNGSCHRLPTKITVYVPFAMWYASFTSRMAPFIASLAPAQTNHLYTNQKCSQSKQIMTNPRVRLLLLIHQPTPPAKHQVPASLLSRFTNRLRLFMLQSLHR